jgi:hypothetical protein
LADTAQPQWLSRLARRRHALSEVKKLKKKRSLRPVKKQPAEVAYPELENALRTMKAIQDDWAAGKARFLELEKWAIQFMKEHKIKTYDRGEYRGTHVAGSTEVVDWDGLKKRLSAEQWKKILGQPMPQKDKLAALMELEEVDADLVAEFITDKPSKEYVNITLRR